ncbi:MAG: hypothetical protein RR983_09640 [Massilia sp.]|uniref:hypothetical protein n=1 Tax=Massilia sp. TaxID=1882437 RepID=UPI002FC61E8B
MLAAGVLTPRRRPGWPLAVTLGLHLLLGWWWLQATGVRVLPAVVSAPREFIVVAVLAPAPSRPSTAPAAPAAPAAAASPRPRAAQAIPARAVPAAPTVAPQPLTPAPADTAPPAATSEPGADPFPTPPGSAQDTTATGDDSLASRGKRTAGAVDHELRKGKLATLDPGDSKWQRFAEAVGNARVDTSRTLISESYTAPDGVVVYRFRLGGRTWCRTGGDIRPSPFGAQAGGAALFDKAGGGGFAGTVRCPTRVVFKPD